MSKSNWLSVMFPLFAGIEQTFATTLVKLKS